MHLTLHLTQRCNLRCRYCYTPLAGRTEPDANKDMTFETAIRAIGLLKDEPNLGIIFFGGEPLLRKDLIQAITEWCEKEYPHRFHYKVTTNGVLLDNGFFSLCDQYGIQIALSHDGLAQDACRVDEKGNGTFETLEPVLSELMERRPYSPVMLVVQPEQVDQYVESVEWLYGRGVRYLICSHNYAGDWDDKRIGMLKRQYDRIGRWYRERYKRGEKVYFSPFDKRIGERIAGRSKNSCRFARRQISVAPDGRLYPCVQFIGREDFCIGDVQTGLLEDRQTALFSASEADKPECDGCAIQSRCNNKCACLNIQCTGNFLSVPPILCEVERILTPLADRLAEELFSVHNPLFVQRHYDNMFPIRSYLEDLVSR
jgi:uncharacterized protein